MLQYGDLETEEISCEIMPVLIIEAVHSTQRAAQFARPGRRAPPVRPRLMHPAWRSNGAEKAPLHRHPVEKATIGFGLEKVPTSTGPRLSIPAAAMVRPAYGPRHGRPPLLATVHDAAWCHPVPTIQFKAMEFHTLLARRDRN
jgi:hypothetical protein